MKVIHYIWMCVMRSCPIPLLTVLISVIPAPIGAQARPIVRELFTSQGCSSCLPAGTLFSEYSSRADLLPLAFRATYRDDLRWKDALSFSGATERQSGYAKRLSAGTFTPRLVVDGCRSAIGSCLSEMTAALTQAREQARSSGDADVSVTRHTEQMSVEVGAGQGSARVLFIGYGQEHRAAEEGENGDRPNVYAKVAHSLHGLDSPAGKPLQFSVSAPAGGDLTVILQSSKSRILGAPRSAPGV